MVDIKWVGSPNFRSGNWRKEGFILHWMAGYLPGTDAMFRPGGSSDIATHYGAGSRDGKGNGYEIHQYVADKDRSFGSFNADADSRGLSIEIENNYWQGAASKPTHEVHELVAQFIAQKIVEHDMRIGGRLQAVLGDFPDHRFYQKVIPQFGRDFNVTTHRSMALKDCPGTTDVEWIVRRANEILNGDDDMPRYRDWEQADKVALFWDIWGTGVGSITNAYGDNVGAAQILAGSELRAGWAADQTAPGIPQVRNDGPLAALVRQVLEAVQAKPAASISDAQVRALGEQLKQGGVVATLDEKTIAAIGKAARASIVKD